MSHGMNIQRTLEAMFRKTTPSSGVFRMNQGMQFGRPAGPYLVFVVMLILVASISIMINGSILLGALLLPLAIPVVAYIIDIQGFEIDFKNGKIRKYRSFLGIHLGEWMDLSAFDSVRVYQHQLKTQHNRLIKRGPRTYDTHTYYYVRIVSPGLSKSISFLELTEYDRAKLQAEKIAKHARLIFIEKPARLKEDKA